MRHLEKCEIRLAEQSRGPSTVRVARYIACEIVWHRWEQQPVVVAVCGVVPVAAIVPVFPSIVHIRHYRGATNTAKHSSKLDHIQVGLVQFSLHIE